MSDATGARTTVDFDVVDGVAPVQPEAGGDVHEGTAACFGGEGGCRRQKPKAQDYRRTE